MPEITLIRDIERANIKNIGDHWVKRIFECDLYWWMGELDHETAYQAQPKGDTETV